MVTGGCGFIGSNFIKYLLEENPTWEVTNLDKLTYAGNLSNLKEVQDSSSYHFVKGDIADRENVTSLFEENDFGVVVNFAAESHVDRSVLDPAPFVETNVKGTQVLLEVAKEEWCGDYENHRFLQISTDEVYGELGETGKFDENSSLQPNSPYAASKASADMFARAYYKTNDFPVVITRSSNNYGPYQFPEKLIPLMINNALKGETLPIYGKGQEVRDWLYVKENCQALDLVLQAGDPGEVYNIGGNCEKKNIEVVNEMKEILTQHPETQGIDPEIEFIEDPRCSAHDFRYALETSKIHKLGWKPSIDFEEGLRKTIKWYLDNRNWVESVVSGEHQEFYKKIYG